jgi:hypothetical protein
MQVNSGRWKRQRCRFFPGAFRMNAVLVRDLFQTFDHQNCKEEISVILNDLSA